MKKFISAILALGCFASMMLASASTPDGSPALLWSLLWIVAAIVCGILFAALNPNFRKNGLYNE